MESALVGWHHFQSGASLFEIFERDGAYYWATGSPGCLYDSDPAGPFSSDFEAFQDAWNVGQGLDVDQPGEVAAAKTVARALYWAMGRPDEMAEELRKAGARVRRHGDAIRACIDGIRIDVTLYPPSGYDARIVR